MTPAQPAVSRSSAVEVIAHRGASRERRENSLAAFERALELGAAAFELDVHATADGVLVVHHDAAMGAATEPGSLRASAISRLDSQRLAAALVGGEPVATLERVLSLAASADATVYVEVKGRGIEALVADAVRAWPDRTAVHAFDHRVSRRIGSLVPVPTGILVECYLVDAAHALVEAGARDYWAHRDFVDADLTTAVHDAGGRVVVWTVNDARDAERIAGYGVDAICTDVPGDMLRVLGTR